MKDLIKGLRFIKEALFIRFRAIASTIIPKKKGVYAFYPILYKREFSGNISALMLYAAQNHKEIKTLLLSRDKNVIHEAQNLGLKTKGTFIGITWATLRAEHIIVDTSTTGNFKRGKFSLIQLWHGTGFKEVGLLNPISKKERKRLNSICKKYNLIVSASESESGKLNASFASDTSVITGSPRNDVFFEDKKYFDDLKVKYNLEQFSKLIVYAPTHRESMPSHPFSEMFYQNLQNFLEANNALFIVKKHPGDKFYEFPKGFQNIKDMSQEFSDIQELLLITDVLISDYSSIITDFALTQKPILIYPYDFKHYKKTSRPMYYDIEEILPHPFIKDENDLLEKLKDESWRETPEAINSYENFVDTFHEYLDGNSSQRVMDAIQNLDN